jgi:hypothetical protein
LSQLDANFGTLANVINDIGAGTQNLNNLSASNVTIFGGSISNVTLDNVSVDVETLSNVTINGGNVTVTNMVATTANATTGNITTVNATTVDTTSIEVTNIKAKNGTASMTIADSTGIVTLSNAVVTTAGAVGTPSITTAGDTNTGIFFPAADTIAFTEGGVEAMRIDSSGNVGIGVTPSAWRATDKAIQLYGGLTASIWTTASKIFALGNNTFVNTATGSDTYISTDFASRYYQLDGAHVWDSAASGTAGNAITFSERMRIDSSGNVGIGTTSPVAKLDIASSTVAVNNGLCFVAPGSAGTDNGLLLGLRYSGNSTIRGSIGLIFSDIGVNANSYITFSTGSNNTEAVRIDSGRNLLVGTTSGTVTGFGIWLFNSGRLAASRNVNGTDSVFQAFGNAGAFYVQGDGDCLNTNNSYGALSDIKLKQNIEDASSQWADIKALRFRKFRMKDDPSGRVHLGVVAQEVEQVSPGLVDEHIDLDQEGNDLGTTTKSVKTSVLLMKAAVALQEAMARIEALEAEVQKLKGN